jgi:hypothetical protein
MIYLDELQPYTERYSALETRPLTVTAHLRSGSPLVAYDPVYLDGLLAWAVMHTATQGHGLARSDDPYWLPLPLRLLWASGDGLPLWGCSVFLPVGDAEPDTVYTHKRPPSADLIDARKIKPGVGRWMDRRVPLPVRTCDAWQARCVGNADAIRELLAGVAFLGKRRGIGFGEIAEWEIAEVEFVDAIDAIVINGKLAHAVPADGPISGAAAPALVGWTPPQWLPAVFGMGWPVGTAVDRVQADWFEAAGL